MALRFGVSAVIVAVLIGITVLVTSNNDDNKSERHRPRRRPTTTTPTTAVPAVLPAGCVDDRPAREPEPADLQIRAADDDRPGQDLHREDLDELR